ncbi:MAG TPA: DUF559 domain-containing protein [Thermoleophilaceae bacterium]|nr:DUF559 domain-containing protein [Thermoleophilaceae bacterium]
MDVRLRELAAKQDDVVAALQLAALGWSAKAVRHHVCRLGWRRVHSGVYALTSARLTRRQRWIAATLTSPDGVLSHASAAACWRFRSFEGGFEIVTRPGNGGPRRIGGVLVLRSTTLDGDLAMHDGIRITSGARTLIDLAPSIGERDLRRAFREALRLGATDREHLRASLERHRYRRGTHILRQLTTHYRAVPYHRARSDPEGRALEVLHDAGLPPPRVNIRVAGEEADLTWREARLIIEIDGPQYHQFPAEDARKQALWEGAGYVVRRIASDAVYEDPARLLALARVP